MARLRKLVQSRRNNSPIIPSVSRKVSACSKPADLLEVSSPTGDQQPAVRQYSGPIPGSSTPQPYMMTSSALNPPRLGQNRQQTVNSAMSLLQSSANAVSNTPIVKLGDRKEQAKKIGFYHNQLIFLAVPWFKKWTASLAEAVNIDSHAINIQEDFFLSNMSSTEIHSKLKELLSQICNIDAIQFRCVINQISRYKMLIR